MESELLWIVVCAGMFAFLYLVLDMLLAPEEATWFPHEIGLIFACLFVLSALKTILHQ